MNYTHESVEQTYLFRWAELNSRQRQELKLLYHIPNGGKRDKKEAVNLKRQGVKAGVPDLCLPVARNGYHGLYIELKAGNNKPTENQSRWLAALKEQGYYTAVCYGWAEAAELIQKYLEGRLKNENKVSCSDMQKE